MIALRGPITPSLWFDGNAEEAANWYIARIENSRIVRTIPCVGGPYPPGTALTIDFELDGRLFNALNAGPDMPFNKGVSLLVEARGQDDYDRVWNALLEDGGVEGPCGWLTDRFGVSWQIAASEFLELVATGDEAAINRVYGVMADMTRLDIGALQAAFAGEEGSAG